MSTHDDWAALSFEIPADSPLFVGHFPGEPVYPGIAHLALVGKALEARGVQSAEAEIVEVQGMRLRRPVAPGDQLSLHLARIEEASAARTTQGEPDGNGAASGTERTAAGRVEFRFELRRGGEVISQGSLAWGSAAVAPPRLPSSAESMEAAGRAAASFPAVAELLPHGPPARLLEAVTAAGEKGIVAWARIPRDHPLARGGSVPGFVSLEAGAQAAAALQALLRPPGDGGPRIGYLVGVRRAWLGSRLPVDRRLRVVAIPNGGAGALAIYEVEISEAAEENEAGSGADLAGIEQRPDRVPTDARRQPDRSPAGTGERAGRLFAGAAERPGRHLASATLSTFVTE